MEVKWLNHVEQSYSDEVNKESKLSWAAFHVNNKTQLKGAGSINSSIMPLFPDEAYFPAMTRHCPDIVQSAAQYVNLGQVLVNR